MSHTYVNVINFQWVLHVFDMQQMTRNVIKLDGTIL